MKTYMPLNGLRWSRNSGSANCDMPQSAVFGRPGGGKFNLAHQTLPYSHNSQSDYVPSMLQDTKISAITFRNKQNGWKSYQMEIRFK